MQCSNFLTNLCISEIKAVNTYVEKASNYPIKNFGRRTCGFLYTLEGTEIYHFHDKTITVPPDSLLFLPKGETYTITFIGEVSVVKGIEFEVGFGDVSRPFCVKFRKNNRLLSYYSEAEKIWVNKKLAYSLECKEYFYKIAAQIVKHESNHLNSASYQKISEAVDYIHEHYAEPDFRIDNLFKIAGISSKYFATLFSKEFNMSPKEYVTSLRIERAKELLASEKIIVSEVASQVGYGDVFHFSKMFKNKTGKSPREYRNSLM